MKKNNNELNLSLILKISFASDDKKSLKIIQSALKKLKTNGKKIKIQDLESIKDTNVYKVTGDNIDD